MKTIDELGWDDAAMRLRKRAGRLSKRKAEIEI